MVTAPRVGAVSWCGAATAGTSSSAAAAWWAPRSGTAPAARATPRSTPTCSSATSPSETTGYGRRSTRAIYHEAKAAGHVHEAAFRRALSRELGVEWGQTHNGIAELDGISAEQRAAFSRRSIEIDRLRGEARPVRE
jgi:hypothetical protein